jgi:hypothetical protein
LADKRERQAKKSGKHIAKRNKKERKS